MEYLYLESGPKRVCGPKDKEGSSYGLGLVQVRGVFGDDKERMGG